MRRGWKLGLATVGTVLAVGAAVGGWVADRTILAKRAWGRGMDAADHGDHAAAEERMSAAIRKAGDPELRASAYKWRARARIRLSKYEEAIADADEAVRLDPSQRLAVTLKGVALYKLGRYDEAARELDSSLGQEPKSVLAHYHRGLVAERMGDLERAETHYSAAVAENQVFASGHAALSRVYRARGKLALVAGSADRAREIDPNVSFEIE